MEKVIDKFITAAADRNDFKAIIAYQWILNTQESTEIDTLQAFMFEYAKGF